MKQIQTITKSTLISEIIEKCPDAIFVLMEYGLMCAGCKLAGNHGLEATKEMYGLNDADVKDMVKQINELMREKGK